MKIDDGGTAACSVTTGELEPTLFEILVSLDYFLMWMPHRHHPMLVCARVMATTGTLISLSRWQGILAQRRGSFETFYQLCVYSPLVMPGPGAWFGTSGWRVR